MTFDPVRSFIFKCAMSAACAAIIALAVTPPVQAQILGGTESLRQKQAEQFEQMFERPDDLDLMFAYALTSIELRDFEAAISTLDRILIFNPELSRVRLELAASYFRIGSYPIAKHYFTKVIENPDADDRLKARATEFLDVINQRTRESYITGVIAANTIFSTNANNGPATREIVFRDILVELTGDDVTAQTDIGASLSAQLTHVYDLGGTTEDSWRTNAAVYSQRFANTSDGAADVLVLRTGPRLSVTEDRYGLKARPYVEFDHVRSSNDALYTTLGGGFELTDTITSSLTLSSDLRLGYREFHNDTDRDGLNLRASAGGRYAFDKDWSFRARALFEFEGADDPTDRAYEVGLEGILSHRYESGFDFAARRWLVSGSARMIYRLFDAPGTNESELGVTRQDFDLRLGVSNSAYLGGGWAVVTKADYYLRESNIQNFDLDSLTVSIGAQFSF